MYMPSYVEKLANRHFYFYENDCVIKKRVKGVNAGKQPLYIWDLTRCCYVSSLIEIKKDLFLFDLKNGDKFNLSFNEKTEEIKVSKVA